MHLLEIKSIIEDQYCLKVKNIDKVKNTYKVETDKGCYCVKVVRYEYTHFKFIISAIEHLIKRGFKRTPIIIHTKDRDVFFPLGKTYAFLTEWVPSRVSNYSNINELNKISEKLAELHKCSEGFNLTYDMKPRIYWYSWIDNFETRCEEILDFKKRINQKAYKTEFDTIYLKAMDEELKRGKIAIEELKDNNYIGLMDKQVIKRGFCHHDFAHHNVLIDGKGEINIIDFDYCILDSHIHDLASFIIRAMKVNKWSKDIVETILNSYSKKYPVEDEELKIMKPFIRFPQGFWQIGLQYYWEQQPWGEEFMVNKIRKYLLDKDSREAFIDNFFR